MAEPISNSEFQSPEADLDFVIGEATYIPKYESSVPREIINSILSREQLPKPFPRLGSSVVEDFIIHKVEDGTASPEEIAQSFISEGELDKTKKVINQVRANSERLNWDDVFTVEDAKDAQIKVVKEMEMLGMTSEQIKAVANMEVAIGEGIGTSSLSNERVFASRLQVIRKATDYVDVFGNDVPFEQVVKYLMKATIAHELGHKVNDVVAIAVNNIPTDNTWNKDKDNSENRGERFAEYWASIGVSDNPTAQQIKSREWLVHLGKVTQLWDAVSTYNQSHEQKADLAGIFRAIEEKIDPNEKDVLSLIDARRDLYGGNEVESYAMPYSRDIIQEAVKPK